MIYKKGNRRKVIDILVEQLQRLCFVLVIYTTSIFAVQHFVVNVMILSNIWTILDKIMSKTNCKFPLVCILRLCVSQNVSMYLNYANKVCFNVNQSLGSGPDHPLVFHLPEYPGRHPKVKQVTEPVENSPWVPSHLPSLLFMW